MCSFHVPQESFLVQAFDRAREEELSASSKAANTLSKISISKVRTGTKPFSLKMQVFCLQLYYIFNKSPLGYSVVITSI